MAGDAVDPFTVTLAPDDQAKFESLDFFGQLDAAANTASKADPMIIILWVIGAFNLCVHVAVLMGITWITCFWNHPMNWTTFHEALLKNAIAYDAFMMHNGFAMVFRIVGLQPEVKNKYIIGSIKESHNFLVGCIPLLGGHRRTIVDMLGHVAFDLSRVWFIISPEPSPLCAWLVFGTMAWMYLFDFCEYVGLYGMYHGPWSVFLLAKYYSAAHQAAATSVLQILLMLLYFGCGIGKTGPWFVSVFAQEWTLPPWAACIDLRRFLYNNNFPKDNTLTCLAVAVGYFAAAIEWVAPLGFLLTASVLGGATGSMSSCVFWALLALILMHAYIVLHIPPGDVWMLNTTPAYLLLNVFYLCPSLKEPGFDYVGWAALHPAFKCFCSFMVAYVAYGQFFPENMTYHHCFRFWAGNWPQEWLLVTQTGMQKVDHAFPKQTSLGRAGDAFKAVAGPHWALKIFGILQNGQLSHRAIPMAVHKALLIGAKARGEAPAATLSEFQSTQDGLFIPGAMFFGYYNGNFSNDALRGPHAMYEMHKECKFEAGEMMLIQQNSFPVFSQIWGGKSHWSIRDCSKMDEKNQISAEGWISTEEALAVTKPSTWAGYEGKQNPLNQGFLE